MTKKSLPRYGLTATGGGWSHPYKIAPFSPFLYADGGDGDGSGSGSGDGGTGDGSGDSGGAGAGGDGGAAKDGGTGGSGDASGGKDGAGKGDGDASAATIAKLQKDLADARAEAGKDRTKAKKDAADAAVADLTVKLGKALGLVQDDAPPDPEALAKALADKDSALAARDAQLRAKDVELAVYARAAQHGAKPVALLDSRSFLKAIDGLDPNDKNFGKAIDDAITAAVKDNPTAYAITPAGRSGGEQGGSGGEDKARKRPTSLSAAIRSTYNT